MFDKIKKRIKKKISSGFTLIETLIAISILMISIAAPLSLAAKGIQAANLAKQQIVAYYLAQDAYEWIKNKIDNNKLSNKSYAEGGILAGDLSDKCVDFDCSIDTLSGKVVKYIQGEKLGYNADANIYGFDSSTGLTFENTIYSRYIRINKIKDDGVSLDEVGVTVTIEWDIPYIGNQKYILVGHITNW